MSRPLLSVAEMMQLHAEVAGEAERSAGCSCKPCKFFAAVHAAAPDLLQLWLIGSLHEMCIGCGTPSAVCQRSGPRRCCADCRHVPPPTAAGTETVQ